MEAQTFSSQSLDQDPANAEPERVATGKHHNSLMVRERLQGVAEGDRIVAGHALSWRRVFQPLVESWSHPLRCRNQIGLLHQILKCAGEGAWGTGIGADHINHDLILTSSTGIGRSSGKPRGGLSFVISIFSQDQHVLRMFCWCSPLP